MDELLKYNGWTNWDTWALNLNIVNDFFFCELVKNIRTEEGLKDLFQEWKSAMPDGIRIDIERCNLKEILDNIKGE